MKRIVTGRRVCIVEERTDKVLYIFSDIYNPALSDQDILCCLYNPMTMRWNREGTVLRLRNNTALVIEVYNEYREIEQWFDKLIQWFCRI